MTAVQVFSSLLHAPEVCEADCALSHCFCTVKILAPGTKSLLPVELCIDLDARLQLHSFRALFQDQREGVALDVCSFAAYCGTQFPGECLPLCLTSS